MAMEEFNKKKNDLETQKAEAEAMMDGAEVGRLEQELAQLEANKHTYEMITAEVAQDATESQVKQITELGGSEEVLHEKVQAKNEEAKEVMIKNTENESVELNFSKELTDEEKNTQQERLNENFEKDSVDKASSIQKSIESTEKLRGHYLDIQERIMKGEINHKNFQSFDGNIYPGDTYEEFRNGINNEVEKLRQHLHSLQNIDNLKDWRLGSQNRIKFLQEANQRLLEDNPGPMMMKAVDANQAEIRSLENTIKKLSDQINNLEKK